jgi:hypothetical protein
MTYSKKYPDDMVENVAESPGMCSDGLGSAPIEIPKREAFSLRGSTNGRKEMTWVRLGKRRSPASFSSRGLGPTGTRHARTVRDTPADSPRGARTVRPPGLDGPLLLPERPELHLFPTSRAYGPRRPGRQSARSSRTIRPITADGPTSLFNFSLI